MSSGVQATAKPSTGVPRRSSLALWSSLAGNGLSEVVSTSLHFSEE